MLRVDLRAPIWRALAASVAIHLVVALLIPAIPQSSAPESVEIISFARVSRVAIERRKAPTPNQPRAQAGQKRSVPELSAPRPQSTPVPKRGVAVTPIPAIVSPVEHTAAPNVAASPIQGAAAGSPMPLPPATPTPQPTQVGVANGRAAGMLPFGAEEHDPVLDPNVLRQLLALNVHVTLIVIVDEDGRSKTVQFDRPIDPQLAQKIQSLLADANWDPAVCGGGIACEGRTTIKL